MFYSHYTALNSLYPHQIKTYLRYEQKFLFKDLENILSNLLNENGVPAPTQYYFMSRSDNSLKDLYKNIINTKLKNHLYPFNPIDDGDIEIRYKASRRKYNAYLNVDKKYLLGYINNGDSLFKLYINYDKLYIDFEKKI